jgi:DNA-binding NarL/FixJ family response regulator
MDINLPGMNGIECVKLLKAKNVTAQFLMCTVYEEDEKVFEALKAGAMGYIIKKTSPAQLLEAITDLKNGGSPMSSQIARKVVASFNDKKTKSKETESLSARENEILELLAKGFRYKEIADKLFISTETVRRHVHNIYEKLHVGSRTDAINKVYKNTLLNFFLTL